MSVIKLRNTFKNSTTIFLGVLYTLIDHSNNVNMFKTHCGTTNRRRVVSLQRFEHFDVTPLVDKCVDHRKSLSICFLTLTFSYALYRHRNDLHHRNDPHHRNNTFSQSKWSRHKFSEPWLKWTWDFAIYSKFFVYSCKHDSKQRKIEKAIRLITVLYTDFIFKILTFF